ncbi:hypothetical protein ACBR40_28170 [Nonomuraea sp. AD125B]|uniref:hypothetical protein n=1 Tax=Nonomuraea sp. AD125B TaxID=3242897 RepID=UPI003527B62D
MASPRGLPRGRPRPFCASSKGEGSPFPRRRGSASTPARTQNSCSPGSIRRSRSRAWTSSSRRRTLITEEPRSKLVREWVDHGITQGITQGVTQGEAKAVLRILEKRGLAVSEEARERIHTCEDPELLLAWVDKALTVTSVDELFEEADDAE